MTILASEAGGSNVNSENSVKLDLSGDTISAFLLAKDPTATLFSTLRFMESVENWVIERASGDSIDAVAPRLKRLAAIVEQHAVSIAPDNYTFVEILGLLNISTALFIVEYLTKVQPAFMSQLLEYCKVNSEYDVSANLMLERVGVLYRAQLLDRVYSAQNIDRVMQILLESE